MARWILGDPPLSASGPELRAIRPCEIFDAIISVAEPFFYPWASGGDGLLPRQRFRCHPLSGTLSEAAGSAGNLRYASQDREVGRRTRETTSRTSTVIVATTNAPEEGMASHLSDSFASPVLPRAGAQKPAHIQKME